MDVPCIDLNGRFLGNQVSRKESEGKLIRSLGHESRKHNLRSLIADITDFCILKSESKEDYLSRSSNCGRLSLVTVCHILQTTEDYMSQTSNYGRLSVPFFKL
ncbi:hypothetical protein CEXT_58111 [Caerostris extrusa]|uniref:Uncharacterized protein n=1 Tax=Caerostris extrusa TaxID=172846 RepID=A0AAV4NEL6_CAEEX|nr:hypothetical protein CEXT_58111 [Caerostris extrusa]